MRNSRAFFFIFVLCSSKSTRSEEYSRKVEKIIEKTFEGYDKRIIPYEKGKPVVCEVKLFINNLADMKPINSHFTLEAIIHKTWIDPRLIIEDNITKENYSISASSVDMLWTPDLVIMAQKSGEMGTITRENIFARIRSDGKVTLSQRYLMTIYCRMQYFLYPFDDQTCDVTFYSYAYSRTWMKLQWSKSNPVSTDRNANAGKFFLLSYKMTNSMVNFSDFGMYDGLQLKLKLRRKSMAYVLRIHTPLTVTVIMSWVCFWINYQSVPARTTVSVCLVLTMIMFITSIKSSLPRIGSEMMMLDLHMFVCFAYVYATLVEYAVAQSIDVRVKYLETEKSKQESKNPELKKSGTVPKTTTAEAGVPHEASEQVRQNEGDTTNPESKKDEIPLKKKEKMRRSCFSHPLDALMEKLTNSHRVHRKDYHILDRISKFAFPFTFIVYNVSYFTFIMVTRKHE